MTTVVFISGESMNDALGALGRGHRPLFEAEGHEFVEIDLTKPGAGQRLTDVMTRGKVELGYSALGMGADIRATTEEGREVNFWEGNGIPFVSINGDSPAYFFDRHVMPTPWHACLYCYPEHLELRRRIEPVSPALYGLVPPFPRDVTAKRDIDFRRKERGRLVFLKNGNDPEELIRMWRDGMSASTFVALADLAGQLSSGIAGNVDEDIDATVVRYFKDRGWEIEQFVRLRLFFVAQLDDYLRRVKSNMLASVLADFPVEIRGYNWEHFDFSSRKANFIPGGDYTDSRELIADSLGVVDMSPNVQGAPHERALRAFGLWTLCLTNEQRFLNKNITNAAAFTYRFDPERLREKVADVIAHPARYVEIGADAAQQFRERYAKEDFARYILDTARMIRLARGSRPPNFQYFFAWPPAATP